MRNELDANLNKETGNLKKKTKVLYWKVKKKQG